MNITSPKDLRKIAEDNVSEQIEAFEEQLKKEHDKTSHSLTIYMATSLEGCKIISRLYTAAGWKKVKCKSYLAEGNDFYQTDLSFETDIFH